MDQKTLSKLHSAVEWNKSNGRNGVVVRMKELEELLDIAENYAPVQHGKWLPPIVGKYGCLCSECYCQADNDFDYCPNCGAKMEGEYNAGYKTTKT